ncbi:MAG: hypothetical protein DME26_04820 [Verrucomicrobia bacterium]|nr:MAG: hypothetical protein DME26_04820 [Verrucomicrobiota bacterium]
MDGAFVLGEHVFGASGERRQFSHPDPDRSGRDDPRDFANGRRQRRPQHKGFYSKARPRLALSEKNVLKINDELGFHPNLTGFKSLYDTGQLSIIQGIGYPNPNRSHFRSTEIWQTASDASKVEKYGWLGRYFDNTCSGCDPTIGVNIGRQMPQAFASKKPVGVSLDNPQNYRFIDTDRPGDGQMAMSEKSYRKLNQPDMDSNSGDTIGAVAGAPRPVGSVLDFLERTALDAQMSSDKIREISNKVENKATYPVSQLANSLKLVARLIGGGLPTRIFYVSQGGYDTHTNQIGAQDRLLRDLGDSVAAFIDDMKAQGNLPRVLVMTFSEFGRRLAENANGGTDHGAASVMFVAGGKVKAGLLGKSPSLAPDDLLNGDPKFTADFPWAAGSHRLFRYKRSELSAGDFPPHFGQPQHKSSIFMWTGLSH